MQTMVDMLVIGCIAAVVVSAIEYYRAGLLLRQFVLRALIRMETVDYGEVAMRRIRRAGCFVRYEIITNPEGGEPLPPAQFRGLDKVLPKPAERDPHVKAELSLLWCAGLLVAVVALVAVAAMLR